MPTKQCNACGQLLEATTDNFHKNTTTGDGFRPKCKLCQNEQAKICRDTRLVKDERHERANERLRVQRWRNRVRKDPDAYAFYLAAMQVYSARNRYRNYKSSAVEMVRGGPVKWTQNGCRVQGLIEVR